MNRFIAIVLGSVVALGAAAQPSYNLSQLLDSARQHNIAIRSARHDIEAAQLQRKEAFTKYFPSVSGNLLWFQANKGMAEMSLDIADKIPPQIGATLSQLLPPETLAALTQPITFSMMKHGTIASLMAVQPVFAGEHIHKDVDVAVRAGLALCNDLLQVELRQNDVASQKLKLMNGLSLVRMVLSQYCGLRDTAFVIAYDPQAVLPLAVKQDHQLAMAGTTEYQLLGKQVEATELQRKMEFGKNLPTVAVGAGYNYHNLLDRNHNFAMVFATVSVPISDWWGGSHAVKRKKIEVQKAQEQLVENGELLKIRMQSAWNGVEEAYNQLQLAERGIEQAQENLRLNRDQYRAGVLRMADLLEAQLLYQQTLDRRTEARADYQNKLLEYRQAVGQ